LAQKLLTPVHNVGTLFFGGWTIGKWEIPDNISEMIVILG
jgi:hypothetical protein